MSVDYKAIALKFAQGLYDHTTGYQMSGTGSPARVVCMECDARADGDNRLMLKHESDCFVGEVQAFLIEHGVIDHSLVKEQNGKPH